MAPRYCRLEAPACSGISQGIDLHLSRKSQLIKAGKVVMYNPASAGGAGQPAIMDFKVPPPPTHACTHACQSHAGSVCAGDGEGPPAFCQLGSPSFPCLSPMAVAVCCHGNVLACRHAPAPAPASGSQLLPSCSPAVPDPIWRYLLL